MSKNSLLAANVSISVNITLNTECGSNDSVDQVATAAIKRFTELLETNRLVQKNELISAIGGIEVNNVNVKLRADADST